MLRQPIVCVLGHVDHGKTTLLDKIRESAVAEKEAGGITQAIGATEIPLETVKGICGHLLEKLHIKIDVPGLLFIDTPGHEAFTSLRKRGGGAADLAILVIDINEGFQPQTDESLTFLKEFKTPFLVAATKIDKTEGWKKHEGKCFLESFEEQPQHAKDELEKKVYRLVGQLDERGFQSERFDRVSDFTKQIAIVPCSGITGEGVADMLMVIAGLAQAYLKDRLEIKSEIGRGSVLEVKELHGLGMTLDIILYDGEIRKGDTLVIGCHDIVTTKIRALLKPKPLRELRVEKEFEHVDRVTAAAGIKVAAPGLENVTAGSPLIAVRKESDVAEAKKELASEVCSVEFEADKEGVILRADTLGSLEALIHIMQKEGIDIQKAEVGPPTRKDLLKMESISDPLKKAIFVFNVPVPQEIMQEAKDKSIKIISNNIIYRIFEEHEKWRAEEGERIRKAKLESITMPGRVLLLKGFVYRANDPAVVGVEVMEGEIRPGVRLQKNGKEVGRIKELQVENQTIQKATKGERVAVSITGPTVGRQIKEGDTLDTVIQKNDLRVLEELGMPEAGLAREMVTKKKSE